MSTSGCDQLIFGNFREQRPNRSPGTADYNVKAEINTLLVGGIPYQHMESGQASLMANHVRSDSFLTGEETSSESQITCSYTAEQICLFSTLNKPPIADYVPF